MTGFPAAARLACLGLVLAAAGCYESTEPLGPPEAGVVDASLLGTWRCVPSLEKDSKDVARLVVMRFDRSQYYFEWREDAKVDRYRAYSTQLPGRALLNVVELKPAGTASSWMFLRVMPRREGAFSVWVVDKDAVKAAGEAAALKEIARRVEDESLYKPWAECATER
jgi:hypothetical protein